MKSVPRTNGRGATPPRRKERPTLSTAGRQAGSAVSASAPAEEVFFSSPLACEGASASFDSSPHIHTYTHRCVVDPFAVQFAVPEPQETRHLSAEECEEEEDAE